MKNIIEDYEKLVYSIAKKYSYNNDIEDLYQVGMIGLFNANKKFNPEFNIKFSSYAYPYIQGEILKYVKENRLIKINSNTIKLNKLINKTKEVLSQKF